MRAQNNKSLFLHERPQNTPMTSFVMQTWRWFSSRSPYAPLAFEISTSTTPHYSDAVCGTACVHVRTCPHTAPTYVWTEAATHRIVGTTQEVKGLSPGVYAVVARSGRATAGALVEVVPASMPTVTGYSAAAASFDGATDGCVVAHVGNVTTHAFCWSNGAITLVPELRDVKAGTYSVSILDAKLCACPYVHACSAAHVGVRQEADSETV